MEDAEDLIVAKVQSLSDIELAVLLSLITEQHCIIEAEPDSLDALTHEISLVSIFVLKFIRALGIDDPLQIASNVFGLTCAVLNCSETTTLDDFGTGILAADGEDESFASEYSRKMANVVVAKNLNKAISQVQVQALEVTFPDQFNDCA